ncbi:MAG TPA: RsmD family RNA methyltransferase [Bacteroidales bacterium]|jgi:16S rRNA (guanine(966)-N(2))-methyltransferase RsmD|nr:RsmD family RNA methyltransferase [Bacteroidales bacterium]HQB25600.1 RsmD family RNA methyltransferase [Bacteroidales bacterium]
MNLDVRPTTDMAKVGLFNVIENAWEMEGLHVLDLFAGTGSISFEFISRGSVEVVAVDNNPRCIDWMNEASKGMGFDNLLLVHTDVFSYLQKPVQQFDIIFADPPYDFSKTTFIPDLIFRNHFLYPGGWLIIEHPKKIDFSHHPFFIKKKNYGRVNFSFFSEEGSQTVERASTSSAK